MEAIHVRQMFSIKLRTSWPSEFIPAPDKEPAESFGFTATNFNSIYNYRLELYCLADGDNLARISSSWATWAKKNAINYNFQDPILNLKLNPGIVDFRKQNEQYARIILKQYVDGVFVQQGVSPVFQILPKKRSGSLGKQAFLEIKWEAVNPETGQNLALNTDMPATNLNIVNSDNNTNSSQIQAEFMSSPEEAMDQYRNDSYMTLYNGNAEVLGNFKALNFYKASDLSLKEDIELLAADRDPRETLLKIDGVAYRFNPSVHPNMNRKFVGYIAQQVESVVPEAVQLIDGILHVDYGALIPFLSESVKQNFKDIQDIKSNTDRLQNAIDNMYEQFIRSESNTKDAMISQKNDGWRKDPAKRFWTTLFAASFSVILLIAASIGLFIYIDHLRSNNIDNNSVTTPRAPADMTPSPNDLLEHQRTILNEFFKATNGKKWRRRDNWNTTEPLSKWFGVMLAGEAVASLVLPNNNLEGELPQNFSQLINLWRLDLSNNKLFGSLHNIFTEMNQLRYLNISRNAFSGEFPNADFLGKEIDTFDASHNHVSGSILKDTLLAAVHFDLSHNYLAGTIPDISKAQSLRHLDLSHNQLTGFGLFISFSTSTYLTVLHLNHNQFVGETNVASGLNKIQSFDLADNSFMGVLTVEAEGTLTYFNISNTQFTSVVANNSPLTDDAVCDASGVPFFCPLPDWLAVRCSAHCDI